MGIVGRIRSAIVGGSRTREMVGTIVEGPILVKTVSASRSKLVFRLDRQPELEFRQVVGPLTPERRSGDRIRVHYRIDGDGIALVEWTERAD